MKNEKKTNKGKTPKNTPTKPEIYEANTNPKNEAIKLLKIVLIVTGVMVIFYGITLIVNDKSSEIIDKQKEENGLTQTADIQYENIMIGSMLNYKGTYYVLIEKADDNRLAEYEAIITTIKSSEDAPSIYKANLTDSFNKDYLGKEKNYSEDLSKFVVIGTTLVKVKDGKIAATYDEHETIKKALDDLA